MFQIGNAAWGLRNMPLEEKLALTSRMGLPLLELSIGGHSADFLTADATDEQIRQVRDLYQKYKISPLCGCTGNDFTGETVQKNLDHVKKIIAIAEKVGVRYLRIFAGFSSDSVVIGERFQNMLNALKEAAQFAMRHNVILAVETHGGPKKTNEGATLYVGTVTTRIDYWKNILETGVKMLFDPANLAAVGDGNPWAFYQAFARNVAVIHLKDFKDIPGGLTPVACGEGRLDWSCMKETLKEFQGPVLLEYEIPEDIEDGLKRSLAFLLEKMGK